MTSALQEKTDMYLYERNAKQAGFSTICGIDEAGRGPLAGPVYAAAVILDENVEIEGLNDSKKLSEKKREKLYDEIIEKAAAYCIESATEKEIDKNNILQATFIAMRRAEAGLALKPDIVFVDGNADPKLQCEHVMTIVKGDANSASIAAASILAKVSRDRYMAELAKEYPQYEFEKHKGYPTKLHYERIREYGISSVHRLSFLKKLIKP